MEHPHRLLRRVDRLQKLLRNEKLAGTRLKHHPSRAGLTVETQNGPVWNGRVSFNQGWLNQPLLWAKPRMIFVCAHGDLFHESVPDEWIDRVFAVMATAKQHVFQVLTKRPERMRDYIQCGSGSCIRVGIRHEIEKMGYPDIGAVDKALPNVWLGVSVENQEAANKRIPFLLDTPAAVRWVSAEPLLGSVDLTALRNPGGETTFGPFNALLRWSNGDRSTGIEWVVVGGESGPGSRPMHPDWARSLRDQCANAGTPFLFKQWGDWVPRSACYHTFEDGSACTDYDPEAKKWPCIRLTYSGLDGRNLENEEHGDSAYMQMVGKKAAGRLLDGVRHDGYPK